MSVPSRFFASRLSLRVCARCLFTRISPIVRHNRPAIHQPIRIIRQPLAQYATISRSYGTKTKADEAVEKLEELYEAAREEFQIAAEETEENTIYAADDRAAAKAELDKLKEAYSEIVDGSSYPQHVKEEVKKRAGQRVRELDNAMQALEQTAMNQD